MSESESIAVIDESFAYEDILQKNGHFASVEVCNPRTATTIRSQNGQVSITDGPYTETKEQLGAIVILEATDLNHAVQLMSKHPGREVRQHFRHSAGRRYERDDAGKRTETGRAELSFPKKRATSG